MTKLYCDLCKKELGLLEEAFTVDCYDPGKPMLTVELCAACKLKLLMFLKKI